MTLRIYAAADIHAKPERLQAVRRMLLETEADVFVAAGDILSRRARPEAEAALGELPVPMVAVAGNSDCRSAVRRLARVSRIHFLHLEALSIGGTRFVGVGGTIHLPFRSLLAFRESSRATRAAELVDADTVLVVHPPPRGVRDLAFNRFHVGSPRLRELVLNRRPKILICGHVHEQAGVARLGDTLVVNCSMGCNGGGALVHLEPHRAPRAEML